LTDLVRGAVNEAGAGSVAVDDIDECWIEDHLTTHGTPPLDLLIRTSGEQRVSNFLLWQIAYSEILFCPTLWPDFSRTDLLQALIEYQRRERRFGGLVSDGGVFAPPGTAKV
jgi:undecaprenyl diphosphate synthase